MRYRITRGDLIRVRLRANFRSRGTLVALGLLAVAWACLILLHPSAASRSWPVKIVAVILFVGMMIAITAILLTAAVLISTLLQTYRGLLGEHILEITDEGLVERTEFNEGLHRWAGIDRVMAHSRFLMIYVTPGHIHIVPWRAFGSTAEASLFQGELMTRIERGRQLAHVERPAGR